MNTRTRRRIFFTLLFIATAVLLAVAFSNRNLLSQRSEYTFESASDVRFGNDSQTIVIDNGKKTVLLLDSEGKIVRRYDGGSFNGDFYYAAHTVQADDGSIYVADIAYGDRGNLLDKERIIRFDGGNSSVIYEDDFTQQDTEKTPLQYGRILEMQYHEGKILFLQNTDDGLQLRSIDDQGNVTDIASAKADGVKNDAAYDIKTNTVIVTYRNGDTEMINLADGKVTPVPVPEGLLPFDLAARNGTVFYTELNEKAVRCFSVENPAEHTLFQSFEILPFKLDVSDDAENVMVTDQVGFYRLTGSGDFTCKDSEYIETAGNSFFGRTILTFIILIIGAIGAVILAIKAVLLIMAAAGRSENTMRIVLIVTASIAVSFVLAYTLLGRISSDNTSSSEKQVSLFAELLSASIDTDALSQLNSPGDYGTEAFNTLKKPLDKHTRNSYKKGDYFYYIIYKSIGGNVAMVMDFEDTMPCAMPMYTDDPEDNDYAEVMHSGEQKITAEISAYGSWVFQLDPIYDEDGNIIGELEVGQSLDSVQRVKNELNRNLIINVATSTIVIAMLLLELTFLISFIQRKKNKKDLDKTEHVPVRTMMFISYLADSMQDAFIAILCTQLYKGGLPVPDGVAIALPLSAQLLMMAVFSLFSGRMAEKYGSRKALTAGMIIQLSGFLCCLGGGGYWSILVGKMLIGSGMGTVYVSCNTVASAGGTSEKIADAFAGVSAGTISGLTIGAGLSSVLLSMGGWRLIYIIGAVIVGGGVLLAISSTDVRPAEKSGGEAEEKSISFAKFMLNPRVLGFFILILLPFMMALSYREYFFPLFAKENGIDEVRIGQIYLLCGVMVIYLGPYLSFRLLKTFGTLRSIIIASLLMGLDMLLFVIHPSLISVILGVVILSVVISFAYTCQYAYFEMTPESSQFGQGRAMGIYSVVESIGQTIGPVTYGALLAFGYRTGIGIFCAAMLSLLAVFVIITRKSAKIYNNNK
ncbi:MAG: MFS transporter [Clostridia bacterium]|nr:MFS transporter [Clostridia bacterium]